MTRFLAIVILAAITALPATALALTMEVEVTPKNAEAEKFSVKAVRRNDGRVEITIVRKLDQPRYIVTSFQLRKDGDLVAESRCTSVALDDTETWHLTLPQDHLAESVFEYAERGLSGLSDEGKPRLPVIGGINHKIHLADFPVIAAPAER